jgi:hypothetical protein
MMQLYFFKKKYCLFYPFLLLFGLAIQAQQNINQEYSNKINLAFSGLDKNRVPHGLLLDFAMDFTNVQAFNGQLTDSTDLDRMTYINLYHTMLSSRVRNVTTGFMLPHLFASTWEEHRRNNNNTYQINTSQKIKEAAPTIVLSGLYYEYSKIRDNALSQGDIAVQNNHYKDVFVNGQWQNPYENKKVFAIAPPVNDINGSVVNFLLPQDIWLSNNPSGINKIEINADDGIGFRQINFNQQISVSYFSLEKDGIRNIIFKLTLDTGETLLSRMKIKFGDPKRQGLQNPPIGKQAEIVNADRFEYIESEETFDGRKAAAILSINYAAGRENIRRPLIVAEGYDPGIITSPEKVFGEDNMMNFLDKIDQILNSDLRDLLTVDSTQEYDIIYVDWLNGVDDMRRNAKLLKTIIEWVNDEKASNESAEENVVLGQSMGGLIARYALREMEMENKDHETRLYISHDSPHQGANVPYGLQFMARHARNEYVRAPLLMGTAEVLIPTVITGAAWFSQIQLKDILLGFDDAPPSSYPSPYAVLTLADMPASRQLLRNFVRQDYIRDNTAQTNWQNELENMGYPEEFGIRNIAISNGSECGITQEIDPGDYLFRFYGKSSPGFFNGLIRMVTDPLVGIAINNPNLFLTGLLPGSSKYNYDIWAKTIPTGSNQQVYKGRIVYTKNLLFLVPIDVIVMNKNLYAPSGSLPMDTYPGGFYNVKAQIDLDKFPSFLSDRITHLENFNFIPVSSALDIGEGQVNLGASDYTATYSGTIPLNAPKNTPFNNFITAYNINSNINPNEQHISFNENNANWLAEELNGNTPIVGCAYICNATEISGENYICSGSKTYSFSNSNVTWSISNSSLASIVSNGNTVTVTKVGNGTVTLSANIPRSDCGLAATFSKTISLGKAVSVNLLYFENQNRYEANVIIAGSNITATPTYSVLSSSGYSVLLMIPNSDGSFTLRGSGSTTSWVKTVKVNVPTSCGTYTKNIVMTPPSTAGGGCDYTLQSTDTNTYALVQIPDCDLYLESNNTTETSMNRNAATTSLNTYSIRVYDMNGILVLQTEEQSISLESLKKGFYIIKAIWNGKETTKKVAKN